MPSTTFEVHDPAILADARAVLDACRSAKEMQDAVIAAVKRNEDWRGQRCINLLAPEAPTSPAVRALLSAEVGTRAAEGNIGADDRSGLSTLKIRRAECQHTINIWAYTVIGSTPPAVSSRCIPWPRPA